MGAGQFDDVIPKELRLNHIMNLALHLFLEQEGVIGVVVVPDLQRGVIRAQFLLCGFDVIVRQVFPKKERQHIVAEIVRHHRAAQVVGDIPKGLAEFLLYVLCHNL